ncbi:zinc finger BED domain-containing 1-like [Brachionus plicatilis]|uniref:Zinc finger BED domain-containing 1-like n=1 Tax=Brachionus plicatilis TaxID=10195 RepID=A0A3M7SP40_BRAPC|nr:zinc finger BED domain-containing 1-like [Brachionus plicatilis]
MPPKRSNQRNTLPSLNALPASVSQNSRSRRSNGLTQTQIPPQSPPNSSQISNDLNQTQSSQVSTQTTYKISDEEFDVRPKVSIPFKCVQCGRSYKAKLGESGNFKKHLEKAHKNVKNWLNSYLSHVDRHQKKWNLDDNLTNLAKYFLTSSAAITEIANPFLRKMLKFDIPCEDTFKTNVLRVSELVEILHKSIQEMLKEAKSICLITDLWSNISAQQYLALAASMVFNNMKKNIRVIGMVQLNGTSNAEAIKNCIETIINRYNFDKRKVCGISCDQGSALVRLFKQNENCLFDELIGRSNTLNTQLSQIGTESSQNDVVYLFNEIDREIDEVVNAEESFQNGDSVTVGNAVEIQAEIANENSNLFEAEQTESDENVYEENSDPINFLNIQIETNSVPRYSCAAHKINLAAYEKHAFNEDNPCPISKEVIISFLRVLYPLYTFSILTQKTDWTIGDLIPALIIVIHGTLETMNEQGEMNKLLELWFSEVYGVEYKKKATDSFAETVYFLLEETKESNESQPRTSRSQPNPAPYQPSDNAALRNLLKSKSYQTPQDSVKTSKLHEIRLECLTY